MQQTEEFQRKTSFIPSSPTYFIDPANDSVQLLMLIEDEESVVLPHMKLKFVSEAIPLLSKHNFLGKAKFSLD